MKRIHNFKDMTGLVFGRLTVLRYSRSIKNSAWWFCECSCGCECEIHGYAMRSGHTQSCGCIHSEQLAARNSRHKYATRKKRHPLYSVWKAMKKRCYNPNSKFWNSYGGKGVKVCERWRTSFANFLADMGERPEGCSLDRIDNDGDYCPENCRWATASQQANNTSATRFFELNGTKKSITQWAEHFGFPPKTLRARINSGWSFERAITTPVKNAKP